MCMCVCVPRSRAVRIDLIHPDMRNARRFNKVPGLMKHVTVIHGRLIESYLYNRSLSLYSRARGSTDRFIEDSAAWSLISSLAPAPLSPLSWPSYSSHFPTPLYNDISLLVCHTRENLLLVRNAYKCMRIKGFFVREREYHQ